MTRPHGVRRLTPVERAKRFKRCEHCNKGFVASWGTREIIQKQQYCSKQCASRHVQWKKWGHQ